MDRDLNLQYKDHEFNDVLCNLHMSALLEKSTVQIIPVLDLVPVRTCEASSEVSSKPDTGILSMLSMERHRFSVEDRILIASRQNERRNQKSRGLKKVKDITY